MDLAKYISPPREKPHCRSNRAAQALFISDAITLIIDSIRWATQTCRHERQPAEEGPKRSIISENLAFLLEES